MTGDSTTALFELDGPRSAPASGKAPTSLVILLHGLGADGNDLIGLAPQFAQVLPDAAFASPHAPFPCDMAPMGRQWFSLQDRSTAAMASGAAMARSILDAYIDSELESHGLSADRLALVGFSQGTMMALYTALRRPKACAALLGYSGMLIDGDALATEIVSRPPVRLIHGDADEVVPYQAMPVSVATLEALQVKVSGHRRPGLGHGIDPEGIRLGVEFVSEALL